MEKQFALEAQVDRELTWLKDLSDMVRGVYAGTATEYEVIKFVWKNWYSEAYATAIREGTDIHNVIDSLIGLEENIKEFKPVSSGSIWSAIFDYDSQWSDDEDDICNQIANAVIHHHEFHSMRDNYPSVLISTSYNGIGKIPQMPKPEVPIQEALEKVSDLTFQMKTLAKLLSKVKGILPLDPNQTLLPDLYLDDKYLHPKIIEDFLKEFNSGVSTAINHSALGLEEKLKTLIHSHFKL